MMPTILSRPCMLSVYISYWIAPQEDIKAQTLMSAAPFSLLWVVAYKINLLLLRALC